MAEDPVASRLIESAVGKAPEAAKGALQEPKDGDLTFNFQARVVDLYHREHPLDIKLTHMAIPFAVIKIMAGKILEVEGATEVGRG